MCTFARRIGHRSLAVLATAGLGLSVGHAQAAVVGYTDLSSWQTAAGTSTLETFGSATTGSFASSFGPVAYNGFSLSGASNGDTVAISTGSVAYAGPDNAIPATFAGQNFLIWGSGDGGVGPTVTFTFAQPIKAFAFDWFNTDLTDQFKITLSPQTDNFTAPPFTQASGVATSGFFGVVSDTLITSATISTDFYGGYVSDEGLDNVRVATVPEPSVLGLVGLAGLALLARRSRRGIA